jgi:hypothetical protein
MRAKEIIPCWSLVEVDTIKPTGSLDATQWRKRSKKQARVQQQTDDENARHAAKERELKARMA